jgi:hypothetical protein
MTNAEIIEIAALMQAVDQGKSEHEAKLERALAQPMDIADRACLVLANKLLEKGRYLISSDNPEQIGRARLLAADMGATVEDVTGSVEYAPESLTSVLFTLPLKMH